MKWLKQFIIFAITIAALLVVGAAAPVWADDYVPGELVVRFDDDPEIEPGGGGYTTSSEPLEEFFETYAVSYARPLFTSASQLQNIYLMRFSLEEDLDEVIDDILELTSVVSAEKNWILSVDSPPNDYHFTHDSWGDGKLDQWPYYKMQSNRAWEITQGSTSVVAAILDTGLDWLHADMNGQVWINEEEDINENGIFDNFSSGSGGDLDGVDNDSNEYTDDVIGWDFHAWDPNPYPTDTGGNHGTAMSSIVSAETNNTDGIAGGTWATRLMTLKIGSGISVNFADAVAAVNYAIDNGAHIVNMSFSSTGNFQDLHDAITEGYNAGLIFVGSAADNNTESARYPGSWSEVIRVAVVDSTLNKTSGSNYGTDVDICAPAAPTGQQSNGMMVCTYDPNQTSLYNGDDPPHLYRFTQIATSGGAAEVTAAVALLKARYPSASASFLKAELFRGAKALPDALFGQGKLGAGMVNPYRSLTKWGTISANTTWGTPGQATTIYVSGDVTVADGYTLTIARGTTIKMANQDNEHTGVDSDRIEFNLDGSILVAGTAADPVVIEGWNSTGPGSWAGFYISDDSEGVTFRNCTIRDAEIAIDSYAPVTLRKVTIEDVDAAAVSVWGTTLTVDVSTFGASDADAIRMDDSGATIDSTTVNGHADYGLYMSGNGALNISKSVFVGGDVGVYVENNTTSGTISKTSFDCGIGLSYYNSTKPGIDECVVTGNTTGIKLDHYSSPSILHCINSTTYDGDITGNGTGIYCTDNSDPTVGHCNISSNTTGVGVFNDSEPDLDGYGANKFMSNSAYHVANLVTGTTVPATGNYWYSNTGSPNYYPNSARISGSVDYTSAQSGAPNPAPPPGPDPKPEVVITGLGTAHPNPFNPTIQIPFGVANPGNVRIDVFDVSGRLVRTLVNDHKGRGNHMVVWDGATNEGSPMASSVYFVRMRASRVTETQKIVLLK